MVETGGRSVNTTLDGGTETVSAGASAGGTIVDSGGVLGVLSYGNASSTIVGSGGTLELFGSASALNLTINAGGTLKVADGYSLSNFAIGSSATLDVASGGAASGTTVNSGGTEIVSAGGTATGTATNKGGYEDVLSGGITSNTTISGGTLELTSGGSAAGVITFAGSGGVLKIDGTTMPTNAISGFAPGDTLDLAGVTYSSAGTVTLKAGNALQIVEGGVTYKLQLDSSQNYSEDSFALSSDGSGGTKVTMTVPSGAETTETPSLTVSSSLSVSPGGSIPMGITATPVDSDDTVSITIKGVPSYEKITAGPGETVTTTKGPASTTTYTITSTTPGAAITDLTLTSTYNKNKVVTNTFTVTASNTTSGETATSLSKTVTVTDPPILTANATNGAPPSSPPSLDQMVAVFTQFIAAGSPDLNGTPITNAVSQTVTSEEQFLAQPHHA
jgi:autotransporter passenger strand-loop-strand repeat protein